MTRRLLVWAVTGALVGAAVIIEDERIGAWRSQDNWISPQAIAQIEALIAEKDTRTPAERKIDSQLLYAMRMAHGLPPAPGVPRLEVDIPRATDGHAIVDVTAKTTPSLLAHVNALTAEPKQLSSGTLQLHLDLDEVEALATDPDVVFIQPRSQAMTADERPSPTQRSSLKSGRDALRSPSLYSAARVLGLTAPRDALRANAPVSGSVITEGDAAHRANLFRGITGATGAGIKIGLISDGVFNLHYSQAAGELGPVTVFGNAGSIGEGTAMLEVIHDVAPDAQLYVWTADANVTGLADGIRYLRSIGCDIIVDAVRFPVESPFQDGQPENVLSFTNAGAATQAVKDVVASGALYFSAAGNEGRLDASTAGVWEGDFSDGGTSPIPLLSNGKLHLFAPGPTYDAMMATSSVATLHWSDPLSASANDYDLFLVNPGGIVATSSTNIQNGTQDPLEQVSTPFQGQLVIVKKTTAASRYLRLDTHGGRLQIATGGQTYGHSATNSPYAFGVAASNASVVAPGPFSSSSVVELVSSDGPRRLFYTGSGVAFTPGNLSSTGGIVIQKPDFTAADNVRISYFAGPNPPFKGTSAAVAHAAAIAALIKSANPSFTQAQIRSALLGSAIDIGSPGADRNSGAGIIMAQPPQPGCSTSVSGPAFIPGKASSVQLTVTSAQPQCLWLLTSNADWLRVVTKAGAGSGTGVVVALANSGPERTGTITTDAGSVTITQLSGAATFNLASPMSILDQATINAPIVVAGLTRPVRDATLSLHLTHTYDADLILSLIGPDNTAVTLSEQNGAEGDDYGTACVPESARTTFSDHADGWIGNYDPPFAGWFQPDALLNAFDGKAGSAANGTWKLRIQDTGPGDVGTLLCASLKLGPVATAASADFEGDAGSDMSLYRPNGDWAIRRSSTGFTVPFVKNLGGAGYTPVPGDYDGDSIQDLAVYRDATGEWVILSSSTDFAIPLTVNWGGAGFTPVPGDYDRDGKTDVAVYETATGVWWILTSTSDYKSVLRPGWGGPGYTPVPGQDFDGDAVSDIAVYRAATGVWSILTSSTNFTGAINVGWGGPNYTLVPGDYDGDAKADLGLYDKSSGGWYVLLSNANYTTTRNIGWGGQGYMPVPGDFDGDGRTDAGIFQPATGNWYVLKSSTNYASTLSISGWGGPGDRPISSAIVIGSGSDTTRATDWDNDQKAEITAYNTSSGIWSILKSGAGYTTATNVSLGGSGYQPQPGDFDGDGRTDVAVYQPTTGKWFVLLSSANFTASLNKNVGGVGWAPVPADYDGDGKTDFGVYNVSTGFWYVLKSSTNYTTTLGVSWGGSGYIAQPADFDGDGKADLALYQQSTGNWIVLLSSTNYSTTIAQSAGGSGYLPVAADYDGDGRADFAVYNSTTGLWYGLKSSTGYTTTFAIGWGGTGYLAIRGDYDGDGRTDLAIYQPSSGNWYVLLSASNYTTSFSKSWGGAGYTAVPNYLYP